MSRITSWNVTGTFTIGLARSADVRGEIVIDEDGNDLAFPGLLDLIPSGDPDDTAELVIGFRSKGYYDPGYIGTPDDNQPPEGDDERTLESCTLAGRAVPPTLADQLFDFYADAIDEVKINPADTEAPDYCDRY